MNSVQPLNTGRIPRSVHSWIIENKLQKFVIFNQCFSSGNFIFRKEAQSSSSALGGLFLTLKISGTDQTDNAGCHSNWTHVEQDTLCKQQHFRPLSHFYHLMGFELHLPLTGRCGRATKPLVPPTICAHFIQMQNCHIMHQLKILDVFQW